MTDIDRTPKPCLHKIANHEHGTYACYVLDRCRCLRCCFASSEYDQQLKRRNAYGRSNYVDAGPARARVAELMAAGVGLKTIVARSGVAQGALWKLVYGKRRADGTQRPSVRITRANAERLLALDSADRTLLAAGARVDSAGTRRRLQALAYLGWSIGRLAAESGMDRQRLDHAIKGGQVVVDTVTRVAELYERLWDQPAPARDHREKISVSRAMGRARREGWAPPAAWDDDAIDDPAARPFAGETIADEVDDVDEVAVARAVHGERLQLTEAEELAAVRQLRAGDRPWGDERLAKHLGLTVRRVRELIDVVRAESEDAA